MLTFCETCIWKLETDDVCRDELNLFELFVLCFVFCFLFSPQMFWEFYLGSSVQIISFLIVILDQVLVETCGSIGLEIFVHTRPPIGFYTFSHRLTNSFCRALYSMAASSHSLASKARAAPIRRADEDSDSASSLELFQETGNPKHRRVRK